MALHDTLRDKAGYLARMAKPMQEKLKVAGYINPNVQNVLDVGCADGQITRALADIFPATHFLGIDLDKGFIEQAKVDARDISPRLTYESIYLRDCLQRDVRYDAVIFTSVLHEFYSYGEGMSSVLKALADAHELLIQGGEIIIRDMIPHAYAKHNSTGAEPIVAKIKAVSTLEQYVADFENDHGKLSTMYEVNHFLLKYMYTDNWIHECKEHYMPVTLEEYEQIFTLLGMELVHRESYRLPYLEEKWKTDFGLTDREYADLTSTSILVARKTAV